MVKLKNNLMIEVEKLNTMIRDNVSNILNDSILEQSIKVDKLVISYTKLNLVITYEKLEIIHRKMEISLPIRNAVTKLYLGINQDDLDDVYRLVEL